MTAFSPHTGKAAKDTQQDVLWCLFHLHVSFFPCSYLIPELPAPASPAAPATPAATAAPSTTRQPPAASPAGAPAVPALPAYPAPACPAPAATGSTVSTPAASIPPPPPEPEPEPTVSNPAEFKPLSETQSVSRTQPSVAAHSTQSSAGMIPAAGLEHRGPSFPWGCAIPEGRSPAKLNIQFCSV